MLTDVLLDTGVVVKVKVAVVIFAPTVTLTGTCAAPALLLDNATTAPPDGAGPLRVTVPVDELPPSTEAGFMEIETGWGALTVRMAVCVVPSVAEMSADVFVATGLVTIAKLAVVWPATMVAVAGTCAAAVLLLERVSVTPPGGAGALIVTVPVEELPPITEDGARTTELAPKELKFNAATPALLIVAPWFAGEKA